MELLVFMSVVDLYVLDGEVKLGSSLSWMTGSLLT